MNQIADILKLAREAQRQQVDAVLATVVRTEGSAYRRAGAMMLICEDGRSVGMISGGCLEPHIIKRAFWLTRHGATVQVYQTGDEQADNDADELDSGSGNGSTEDELNFGLGCNGKVHVLFERLNNAWAMLNVLRQVRDNQYPSTIATLIRTNYSKNPKLQIGSRIAIAANVDVDTDVTRHLTESVFVSADHIPKQIQQELSGYKISKNNADYLVLNSVIDSQNVSSEWLVQRLQPQIRLLICGAGNDVMPLVTMAKLQDWHVAVVDSRAQYATMTRFPTADLVLCLPLDAIDKLLELSNNAAIALMSHSLSQDRARLAVLLKHAERYQYLGQLGPRYRTERLISEITSTLDDPTILANGINQLHYPIGYKLGGDGPEALALSIIAQISAVVHEQATVNQALAQPQAQVAASDFL